MSNKRPSVDLLAATTITTAVAAGLSGVYTLPQMPVRALSLEAIFVYGSGGTTVDAWVQTSLDDGVSWFDIAQFAFLLASLNKVTVIVPSLGEAGVLVVAKALADDTKVDVIGDRIRVAYTTTGTYADTTTLQVVGQLDP